MKRMRGYSTRFVELRQVQGQRSADVQRYNEEMFRAGKLCILVFVGRSVSKLRRPLLYKTPPSFTAVTYVFSRTECARKTVLVGSSAAVANCGHAHTVKLSFDFFLSSTRRHPRSGYVKSRRLPEESRRGTVAASCVALDMAWRPPHQPIQRQTQ